MDWTLTVFDFIVFAILVFSIVISFLRGFVREVVSLLTWIVGIVVAVKFSPFLSQYFAWFGSDTLQYIIAFALIFIVIFIVGALIARLLKDVSYAIGLGFVDHILGFVFGLARGGLVVILLIMLIGTTPYANSQWFSSGWTVNITQGIVLWAESFLPKGVEHVHQWIGKKMDSIDAKPMVDHASNVIGKMKSHVVQTGVS